MQNQNRYKILIVEDEEINRDILTEILNICCDFFEAQSASQAFEIIDTKKENIDLILLDLGLPDMDGIKVLKILKDNGISNQIPVVVITADTTEEAEEEALKLGAADFIRKPFSKEITIQRIKNTVELYTHRRKLQNKIENINDSVVEALSNIIEYRSVEVGGHVKRIKLYTNAMLQNIYNNPKKYKQFNIKKDKIELISQAAMLHDIGKISIPDHILLKPGKLTEQEFEIMKTHSENGDIIITNFIKFHDKEYKELLHEICRWHHERWNGNGYPDGLKGNEIPVSAQIVGVADVYDALTSDRVYKKAYSHEESVEIINKEKGSGFSELMIDCFNESLDAFENILQYIEE